MANNFTVARGVRYGGQANFDLFTIEGVLVIDTTATAGAAAGNLPATMFGLTEIVGPASIVISDNSKNYIGTPAYDKASMLVSGGASNAPMNLPNGTYRVAISGRK